MTYTWDERLQKYRNSDGSLLSDADLKRIVLFFVSRYRGEFESLAKRLWLGEITIGEWQREFASRIRTLHIAMAAVAFGGIDNLDEKTQAWLSSLLRFQYERLERFARQIEMRHWLAVTQDRIAIRSAAYALSANQTFEESRRLSHRVWQFALERNVLGPAEHCPECLALTARGWVQIGELKPPGTRLCKFNCKCRLEFAVPPITEKDGEEE